MSKGKISRLVLIAIPIIFLAGCKMGCSSDTKPTGGAKVAYDYTIATTDSMLTKTGNVYKYDLGGVEVLSTFDVRGGVDKASELKPAQGTGACDGDNNVFIVRKGNEVILVDAGYGDKNPSSMVKVNFEAFGIDMNGMTKIIMTHLHPDHSAGLTNGNPSLFGGVPTKKYANAKIYVPKKELDFWTQETLPAGVASDLYYTKLDWAGNNTFFAFGSSIAKDMVTAYGSDVITFEDNFNGDIAGTTFIKKMNLFGHTPGHTAYIIEGSGKKMIIAGDFVNCARVQFDDTSVSAIYDFNFAAAKQSREALMKYAVENNIIVGSTHAPAPGFMNLKVK